MVSGLYCILECLLCLYNIKFSLLQIKIDMANFPDFEDDIAFLKQLIVEQGVMCLPGTVGFVSRILYSPL